MQKYKSRIYIYNRLYIFNNPLPTIAPLPSNTSYDTKEKMAFQCFMPFFYLNFNNCLFRLSLHCQAQPAQVCQHPKIFQDIPHALL